MIERRGYDKARNPKYDTNIKTDKGFTYHPGHHWIWSEMDVKKKHGIVLASICFQSYKLPVISIPSQLEAKSKPKTKVNKLKK